MKKIYQEPCLEIVHFDLDVITSSIVVAFVGDSKDFNKSWLDN